MERPGGGVAQAIRATRNMQGNEPLPEYLQNTAAIPLGELPGGDRRYLTTFGAMHEDTLPFFGGGVQGALQELGSRLHPIPKSALEWTFGESLFQKGLEGGRDISDLDPTLGRTISNVADNA